MRRDRSTASGAFVGKAAFYTLRYGDYLIAINTTSDQTFELKTPADIRNAVELIVGQNHEARVTAES